MHKTASHHLPKKIRDAISVALLGSCFAYAQVGTAADKPQGPDQSWLNISGTVAAANADFFYLDYGEGVIRVEMDDWDWYKEGANLLEGDTVTVYGRIDDDIYETKTIEAHSVYVAGLNSFFYASSDDEEDWDTYVTYTVEAEPGYQVTGKVTSINGRQFTIDTGNRKLTVNTSEMPYNPLDQYGYQKIEKGDRVSVTGEMDLDLLNKQEIQADSIVTLVGDKRGADA